MPPGFGRFEDVAEECLTANMTDAIAVDRFEIGKMEYWAF